VRLDFEVLWIDDQPGSMASNETALKLKMRAQGFDLRVTFRKSVAEAKERLGDSVFKDHVDLILVDYELGKGVGGNGDEALRTVRDAIPYRDMVFYSSKSVSDLRTIAHKANVEGVHCATRADLLDVVERVFEAAVRRVLDIDHSRGIVMGATCDIDHRVNRALTYIHSRLDPVAQAKVWKSVGERIEANLKKMGEKAKELRLEGSLEPMMELYDLVTSNDRLRLLTGQLKANPSHKDARERIVRYMRDVIPNRNIVAHVRSLALADGERVLRSARRDLSEADLRKMRIDLLDHRENFEALLEALGAPKE
jgi:hypothetical protein